MPRESMAPKWLRSCSFGDLDRGASDKGPNPRPEGAESTLAKKADSPFHAEPRQGLVPCTGKVTLTLILSISVRMSRPEWSLRSGRKRAEQQQQQHEFKCSLHSSGASKAHRSTALNFFDSFPHSSIRTCLFLCAFTALRRCNKDDGRSSSPSHSKCPFRANKKRILVLFA